MKKNCFVAFCLIFSFVIVSCYSPVFYNIAKEVKLTSKTVSGFVNSVVRYTDDGKEYLLTQNGKSVFYKLRDFERTSSSSAWNVRNNETFDSLAYNYLNADYNGEYIINIAGDSEYIYIITGLVRVDHDKGSADVMNKKIYYSNSLTGATWQEISFSSISIEDSTIFCTNAIEMVGRKAYFRNGSDLYLLDGSNAPILIDKSTINVLGGGSSVNSAVWFKDSVLFFGTLASATNETLAGGDASMVYFGASDGIHYSSDGVNFETAGMSVGTISCMVVTKDYLLFGKGDNIASQSADGGIYKVALTNEVPGTATVPFTTNADSVFTSSYQLVTLFAVDAAKNEVDNIIYASPNFKTAGGSISVSYDNICLWAYYPSRGNWNRE